jgi:hypothetical protein
MKQHYHLVSGVVMFKDLETEGAVGEIKLNTTLRSGSQSVPARQIGKAQQSLQMLMFQKLGTELEVVDVHIVAISYLGHMTEEQFMAPPEGMKVQETIQTPALNS